MSCEFSIPITLSTTDIITRVSDVIKNNGGNFIATDNGGEFTVPISFGTISGNFEIISDSANVTITKKPFFVSCNKIKSTLTDYITSI
jgi:hypothetical protein